MRKLKDCIMIFFILLNLFTFARATETNIRENVLDPRIVGGDTISIDQVPYQVSFQVLGNHNCGGSILNENTIITAAHCVSKFIDEDYEYLRIEAGVSRLYTSKKYFGVSKIIQHELYNKDTMDYDIALIKLDRNIEFNKNMKTVLLQDAGLEVPAGTEATISGWGRLNLHGPLPSNLNFAKTKIMDTIKCSKYYENSKFKITERMICARKPEVSTCNGDSGGPLIVDGKLVGLTSWTQGCGSSNSPDVFTKIANLRPWIDKHITDK